MSLNDTEVSRAREEPVFHHKSNSMSSPSPPRHGESLIPQAQPFEERELLRLLVNTADRMRQYISSKIPERLRSTLTEDDVLQDTWVCAFRDLPQMRPTGPQSAERWLTSLANHRLLDAIRAEDRLKRGGGLQIINAGGLKSSFLNLFGMVTSQQQTPSSELRINEAVQWVRRNVNELEGELREAVWMRHVEGRSIADIADRLQKTKPAVHSLLFRGLHELRKKMGSADMFFTGECSCEPASSEEG